MIYENVEDLVGNTPLLKISEDVHKIKNLELYAKLEMNNPFGSVKDRVALNMIKNQINKIKKEKKTVIESSSGNTAKALAVLCAKHNIEFETITNRIKIDEVRDILKILDAKITELPGHAECPDPTSPDSPAILIQKKIEKNPEKYHHTDQYFNQLNIDAHKVTGKEINKDLGDIDYFFADLGTCGSSRGIGSYLRETQKSKISIVGVITSEGGFVPGGRNENELYETGFFDKDFYDHIIKDTTKNATLSMRELNLKSGLLCGPTTGLIYAALKDFFKKNKLTKKTKAVFLACDRLEPYLSYVKQNLPEIFSSTKQNITVTQKEITQVKELLPGKVDDKKQLLIDIRTPFAYSMGHIKNSLNIPEHMLSEMIHATRSFPEKEIVLICPKGLKSKIYAAQLIQQNYYAFNLKNGLEGWIKSKKELVQNNICK